MLRIPGIWSEDVCLIVALDVKNVVARFDILLDTDPTHIYP